MAAGEDLLPSWLAGTGDLEAVIRAVAREQSIRECMAKTGESREVVTETLDAMISMDQEFVLDLTEGEPTTLRAALTRYVEQLESDIDADDSLGPVSVASHLSALVNFSWPGEGGRQ